MSTNSAFRVVAALDLDDTAGATWKTAAALLANPAATLSVVHVVRARERDLRAVPDGIAELVEETHHKVQQVLERELAGAPPDVRERVDLYLGVGEPAAEIVQVAIDLEADVVVVGTNEKRGLERIMLGSVSREVFRTAPCSVLVARSTSYAGAEKTPQVEPPLEPGQPAMIRATPVVRYRSLPFSTYNANLFPTGIPRGQVR